MTRLEKDLLKARAAVIASWHRREGRVGSESRLIAICRTRGIWKHGDQTEELRKVVKRWDDIIDTAWIKHLAAHLRRIGKA